jgi:hypothetical protein
MSVLVENRAMPSAILVRMVQSFLLRSAGVRPSFSELRLISENSPWKLAAKDSFSMCLKPRSRVCSSSLF